MTFEAFVLNQLPECPPAIIQRLSRGEWLRLASPCQGVTPNATWVCGPAGCWDAVNNDIRLLRADGTRIKSK